MNSYVLITLPGNGWNKTDIKQFRRQSAEIKHISVSLSFISVVVLWTRRRLNSAEKLSSCRPIISCQRDPDWRSYCCLKVVADNAVLTPFTVRHDHPTNRYSPLENNDLSDDRDEVSLRRRKQTTQKTTTERKSSKRSWDQEYMLSLRAIAIRTRYGSAGRPTQIKLIRQQDTITLMDKNNWQRLTFFTVPWWHPHGSVSFDELPADSIH